MYLGPDLGPERLVHEPMATEATHSAKAVRSHADAKVTGATDGAGVPAVQVALVDDGERLRRERRAQQGLDALASIHGPEYAGPGQAMLFRARVASRIAAANSATGGSGTNVSCNT